MSASELAWLAALGVLVAALVAGLRPLPVAASVAAAAAAGWLLEGWGFWGYALAAAAAAVTARATAARLRAGTAARP